MAMPRCLRSAIDRLERVGDAPLGGEEAVRCLVAGDLAHALGEDRAVFDPVSVGVDDGMF
jgi:hypothetical protein